MKFPYRKTHAQTALSYSIMPPMSILRGVFNACFSEPQAQSVVEYIDAAIGMSTSISDEAACVFAAQLYSSIGFGCSLHTAFNQAIAQLMLEGIPEDSTPKLYVKDSMDANDITLVQPSC